MANTAEDRVELALDPKYFKSSDSPGYLQTNIQGEEMYVRAFWDEDDDGAAVAFLRLGDGEDEYLYVAIHWGWRTIVGTAFASTDKQARRLLLEDLERRGWRFR